MSWHYRGGLPAGGGGLTPGAHRSCLQPLKSLFQGERSVWSKGLAKRGAAAAKLPCWPSVRLMANIGVEFATVLPAAGDRQHPGRAKPGLNHRFRRSARSLQKQRQLQVRSQSLLTGGRRTAPSRGPKIPHPRDHCDSGGYTRPHVAPGTHHGSVPHRAALCGRQSALGLASHG